MQLPAHNDLWKRQINLAATGTAPYAISQSALDSFGRAHPQDNSEAFRTAFKSAVAGIHSINARQGLRWTTYNFAGIFDHVVRMYEKQEKAGQI